MKIKKMLFIGTLLVSIVASAQKDELKALKKIYAKENLTATDVVDYKSNLSKLEALAIEENDKVFLKYYKCSIPQIELHALGTNPSPIQLQNIFTPKAVSDLTEGFLATLEHEKKTGKKVFADDINESIITLKPLFINAAVALGNAKKDIEAASILYSSYQLDKKNQDLLYYAASSSFNGNDFETALKYYQELKKINYSGETINYYAFNKASKQEESFPSKELRDTFIKAGTHEKPKEEKIPSKKGEIYKNIVLILDDKGRNEEAKVAYPEARKANPDDIGLILNEANFYLKLNDTETYTKIVNEALLKEPNNAELVFNLGVISANSNKIEAAEGYYKKAIEIDATYFNAYINLVELKMRSNKTIMEEINKLGTSDKDLKKYDALKAERNKNLTNVLPFLEKAVELKPEDTDTSKTLLSVYNALEMTEKYKALKAKL